MVTDRILCVIVLCTGVLNTVISLWLTQSLPVNLPPMQPVTIAATGCMLVVQALAMLRRRTQPVRMFWLALCCEVFIVITPVMQVPPTSAGQGLALLFLAYALVRYSQHPVRHLIPGIIIVSIVYAMPAMVVPVLRINTPILALASLVTALLTLGGGALTGFIVLSNQRLQDAQRQMILAEERTRIARELHDTTAHHLSSIAIQTTAARAMLDTDPAAARSHLEGVSASISAALADVRATVSTLRNYTAAEVDNAPQPTLDNVPELIKHCRELGMDIRVQGSGLSEGLTTVEQRCAYRILQEALTNARKHAPGAAVEVTLYDAGLKVHTRGSFTAKPLGRGGTGMRERAAQCGAELLNGPAEHGWLVVLKWKETRDSPADC